MTGAYRTPEDARRAAAYLREFGFTRQEVCMLAGDELAAAHFAAVPRRATLSGLGGGVLLGLALGALLGAIAGVLQPLAAVSIPALHIVVGGPLVSALIGAVVTAMAGGCVGALLGATHLHHETVVRAAGQPGFALVGVAAPRTMAKSAAELLHTAGAFKVTRE